MSEAVRTYVFTEYGGPENQDLIERELPDPGPSEVLIEVRAAGVNPVDWKIRQGFLREVMPLDMPAGVGREAAGIVRKVGQDVEGLSVGDEVFGNVSPTSGGIAEAALLSAGSTARKPPGVAWETAAVLPVSAATAYDGLAQLACKPGEILLINGAGGGVGVVAAQLARDQEITVVGVASADKRELVESLGAVHVASGQNVAERVHQVLPDGVHAILDLVGGDALRAVAGLVTDPSRIVTAADPDTAAEVGGAGVERDGTSRVLDAVMHEVAAGKLDPHVNETFPLSEAAEAIQAVEDGHARGKVVVTVGG
ncbi:NADPH:quinone reductase-like Zn-dependent oxidoreductase [Pseudonocardia sediminis]|uniref:NADPH:quinone reductase-like Zn-dependent oxidoreductase n=1 Tax=Pseudonocardia sediminis TaxID=1397368 RepID=A0A4Q7UXV3_PSEST|nr:NADP-dependent oxidoreductase [Pseudonocardia sediminis]RZT85033.1 NADPH:quinone reductase-like Zn-dependent oxidoreductase [Pseudonocardia sediminis]